MHRAQLAPDRSAGSHHRLFETVDGARATDHIDAMALGIDKEVIGIAAGVEIGDGRPVCVRQHQQPRRATEGDQDPVRCAIERHREIRMMALGRKRPDCLPFREIDDLDQPGIGHIDKSPCAAWFDLKAFRMRS